MIREFLDELEGEMEDLTEKQKVLVASVNENIDKYCELLAKDPNVMVDRDLANGFVTRAIDYRRVLCKHVVANSVEIRKSANGLKQKL
jgi:hypothetical protein